MAGIDSSLNEKGETPPGWFKTTLHGRGEEVSGSTQRSNLDGTLERGLGQDRADRLAALGGEESQRKQRTERSGQECAAGE